jgi:hypothetical protein
MSAVLSALALQGCSTEPAPKKSEFAPGYDATCECPHTDAQARDIRITEVAIYQVVKIPLVKDGKPVIERNAPVVLGKDAFLRVFVQPLPGFTPHELEAELTLWSEEKVTPPVLVRKLISGQSKESKLDSTINFDLPSTSITGDLRWSVILRELDPVSAIGTIDDSARYPKGEGELEALHPRYVGPLHLMLVPYRYNADGSGRLPDLSDDQLQRYRSFLTAYYPVGEVVLKVHEPVDYNQVVDPSSGWDAFLDFHCALRANEHSDPRFFYYGLIAPARHALEYADGSVGLSNIPGPEQSDYRCSVGLGFLGGQSALIMLHELGHALGLGHTPCGADDAGPYPYADGKIGSWGYIVSGRRLMAPDEQYDLMSRCDPVFISDYTYQKVFERLRYLNLAAVGGTAVMGEPAVTTGTRCGVGLPVTCTLGTEKCCIRSLATDRCIAMDAPCTCDVPGCTTLEARCDGPEDCNQGQVCCGTLQDSSSPEFSDQANRYMEFTCQSNCDYNGAQRIACHQMDPQCPTGTICTNSQLLTNLQICIDPATIEQ